MQNYSDKLADAMSRYYDAKKAHDDASADHDGYSWDYHGADYISAMNCAKAEWDKLIAEGIHLEAHKLIRELVENNLTYDEFREAVLTNENFMVE